MSAASCGPTIKPVLNLYYNQAQSRQHPKRCTASTKLVLQSSFRQEDSAELGALRDIDGVVKMYRHWPPEQAQSRQHPKRGTASTKLVLQSSTIQPTCTTVKNNPGSIRNEAQPVLNLYYNQAQSRQHPKRGTASTKLVLQSSTIQPTCTTVKNNPGSIRNEAQPVLNLYYNQAQSRQHPKRGTASTQAPG